VWWIPDILAAAVHGLLYVRIPPYIKPFPSPQDVGTVQV